MAVPSWLLRKLYRKGSLAQIGDRRFAFTLQNTLSSATLIAPPRLVINGVSVPATDLRAIGEAPVSPGDISTEQPVPFPKGARFRIEGPSHLLLGANRIHLVVETLEFGKLELFIEDRAKDHCVIGDEEE